MRKRFVICLALALLLANALGYAYAAVNMTSSLGWIPVVPAGNGFDYISDQQTGSGSTSQDIVGSDAYPAFYVSYDSVANEIGYRIRVNAADGTSGNLQFKNFALVGVDANQNGGVDFFVGAYNPTANNGRIAIYDSDPSELNTGPSTTGIDAILRSYTPSNNHNYSIIPTGDGSNFSGNPDYFVSFKIPVADINQAMVAAGRGISINASSPLRYIIGTASQDNSFNQDIGGLNGLNIRDTRTWDELGTYTPSSSLSGNMIPVALNSSATTPEDVPVSGALSASDSNNDPLSWWLVSQGTKGTVSINPMTGAYTYTPNPNAFGTDTFTFRVHDGSAYSNTGTITVTIVAVNDLPVAQDSAASTAEDSPVSGNLVASDPDGDSLTWTVVGQGAKGVVSINASTGAYTYTPSANATGADSFTFRVNDGKGGNSNLASVSITITAVNDLPVAQDMSASTAEESPIFGQLVATDTEGDQLAWSIVSQGSKGIVGINPANGAFVYTPLPNATGADLFTFHVNDGKGNSNTATVSITINGVNDVPVAQDAAATTDEDEAVSGTLPAWDPDGDALAWSVVSQGSKGTVVVDPLTGAYTYTPNANAKGVDTFTFKANDGTVDSNIGTITITINAVNDLPVAQDMSASTAEDSPTEGQLVATDPEGDQLTWSIVSQGSKGTVSIDPDTGAFVYTPEAGANGPDSFTFKVNDGLGDSNTATVSVTITAVNDLPAAQDSSVSTSEDTAVSGTLPATDSDGDALVWTIVSQGSKGTVSLDPETGLYTYTPHANANGSDSFTFKVNDGTVDSNTATVAVSITPVNDLPDGADTHLTIEAGNSTEGDIGVADPDGDPLEYSITRHPAHGTASVDESGHWSYAPENGFEGDDSFTIEVSDGQGGTIEITIWISVTGANASNDAPIADDATGSATEDSPVSGTLPATDPDADALTWSIVSQGTKGTVVVDPLTGAYTYTPNANAYGVDTFTFKANDGTVDSNIGTVTITVSAVNDRPVATGVRTTIKVGTSATGSVGATDPDGDTLGYTIGRAPAKGSATVGSDGRWTYTPQAGFVGEDSFTVVVDDGNGGRTEIVISVTVLANPVIPTITTIVPSVNNPKTGDTTQAALLITMLIALLSGGFAVLRRKATR